MRRTLRSWALHNRSDKSLDDIARMFNPIVRGWIQYYGRFYKSALYPTLRHLDRILVHWARRKYKRLRRHRRRARHHPQKTKVVYCKDDDRRGSYRNEQFDFLGYTFRARRSKSRWGKYFVNFTPAVSNAAAKAMRRTLRSWALHNRSDKSLDDIARMFNPIVRGWIQYYGRFYKSALYPTLRHLDRILVHWARRKYKRLRRHRRRARHWLGHVARRQPTLFAHWGLVRPEVGR